MAPTMNPHIIGDVFERKASSGKVFEVSRPNTTGFPAVQHRSKSAFARSRHELRQLGDKAVNAPPIITSSSIPEPSDLTSQNDDLHRQISDENVRMLAGMSAEEIEQERLDILSKFGPGVQDLFKKANERKQVATPAASDKAHLPLHGALSHTDKGATKRAFASADNTRPSSRADRKIRFAEVTSNDVHVYESAPPSPRKKALALPPPDPSDASTSVSLGTWRGALQSTGNDEPEPDEGTPEYIRRRFFPNQASRDPNLAWMEYEQPSIEDESHPTLRFDLTGSPISAALASSLPTHLGLHHHSQGALAGYTLDDIFLLSRSTVPAQRATMLDVLARIAHKLGLSKKGQVQEGMEELQGQEEELRKRVLAAGIEAMSERGSLGARATEVIWECVVAWDKDLLGIDNVELRHGEASDAISSLPLEFVLPQIATLLGQRALPPGSLSQLLAILHRLAQHSNTIASDIVSTPQLIASVLQTFLLTPIPPTDNDSLPDPVALQFLITVMFASRDNALALVSPADALLRFITMLPPDSPLPDTLAVTLLTDTIRFYTVLASYGLYSHIATTAAAQFAAVGTFVKFSPSRRLLAAWTGLLEAWIICATDPHQTTPDHDILWSQIAGWGWADDILELRENLSPTDEANWEVFGAIWSAEAAWLEGSRVNGVRQGEAERQSVINTLASQFESGKDSAVVQSAIAALHADLEDLKSVGFYDSTLRCVRGSVKGIGAHAAVLRSAIRLWIACSPTSSGPLTAPPFILPFSQISALCAQLVNHTFWPTIYSPGTPSYAHTFVRPLSAFLSYYLQLSQRLPDISPELLMAQGFSILSRMHPGDEELALALLEQLLGSITPESTDSRGWEGTKMAAPILKPFFTHVIHPFPDVYIGPLCPSPKSIKSATTLRLPSGPAVRTGAGLDFGLPLAKDWLYSPLDHLLRSGSSSVFKALPLNWDASETDITCATLFVATAVRDVLERFSLTRFLLTREETVLGCMKVFMLEHGQSQSDTQNEVFRNATVGRFMDNLLQPFTLKASASTAPFSEDLEKAAARFLGPATPFYQYYTDFVALYDAISFSHPLFGRLLLPPLSMRYAHDYRKHLWDDFGHVLRSIRTPVDEVLTTDLREYFWPLESDGQVIAAYLRALIKSNLHGFLRMVALHHIACNVWPDSRAETDDVKAQEQATQLLNVVVAQGNDDLVRDIARYKQTHGFPVWLPPQCFEHHGTVANSRLEFVERAGGASLLRRVQDLLL